MDESIIQDIVASHTLINLLASGYQGAYAGMNSLIQSQHFLGSQEILLQYDRTIARITRWNDELFKGIPLISKKWTSVETFEAQTAFDDLAKLRKELVQGVDDLKAIKGKFQSSRTQDDIKLLFSLYVRFAYARDSFIRGQIDYAKNFRLRDLFDNVSKFAAQIEGAIPEIDGMFDQLNAPNYPKEFVELLDRRTSELVTTFALQAHEMSLSLAMFEPALTYELADIGKYEAERWVSSNIAPAPAGYWRAFDIGPEEAAAWMQVSIDRPAAVNAWRKSGFSPGDAVHWAQLGIPPEPAALWRDAGFTAEESLALVKKGVTDPQVAKKQKKQK